MDAILECRNLTRCYENGRAAINRVNLLLPKGRIIGLLGPNGSGKSTFFKLANGLLAPTEGEIRIDGMPVGLPTRRIVSYLPERNCLNPSMRVRECVRYYQDFFGDFDVRRAYDMLADVRIDPAAVLRTLSKGTREKVQLILTMSRRAALYMLDEPIGGVDPAARDYVLETIVRNRGTDATILIATQLIADVEPLLDEVIFLKEGEVVLHAQAAELREETGESVDEQFRRVFRF